MILIQVGLEARYAGADAMGSDKPYKRYHDNLHDIAIRLTSKRVDAKENLCLKIMMFILRVIYICTTVCLCALSISLKYVIILTWHLCTLLET